MGGNEDGEADLDELLAEQISYYRARAGEYDRQMWAPERYDGQLAAEVRAIEEWVARLPLEGRVLELACGTGRWTEVLAQRADHLVAVDAAPEMIDIARRKVATDQVGFVVGDVFDLELDGRFDAVFFSFLLSHIPPPRFEHFWGTVRDLLREGGTAAFVDAAPSEIWHETRVEHPDVPLMERELSDGSWHRVVMVFYDPDDLASKLEKLGWHPTVDATGSTFLFGEASRDPRTKE